MKYSVPGGEGRYYGTTLEDGLSNPEAVRSYRVFVDREEILLIANPDDPVTRVLDEIYRNAVK